MTSSRWLAIPLRIPQRFIAPHACRRGFNPSGAKEIVARYDQALGGRDALMRHTSSTIPV